MTNPSPPPIETTLPHRPKTSILRIMHLLNRQMNDREFRTLGIPEPVGIKEARHAMRVRVRWTLRAQRGKPQPALYDNDGPFGEPYVFRSHFYHSYERSRPRIPHEFDKIRLPPQSDWLFDGSSTVLSPDYEALVRLVNTLGFAKANLQDLIVRWAGIARQNFFMEPFWVDGIVKPGLGTDHARAKGQTECVICLEEFEPDGPDGAGVRCEGLHSAGITADCNHAFGLLCLNRWLDEDTTCPLCRQEFDVDLAMLPNSVRLLILDIKEILNCLDTAMEKKIDEVLFAKHGEKTDLVQNLVTELKNIYVNYCFNMRGARITMCEETEKAVALYRDIEEEGVRDAVEEEFLDEEDEEEEEEELEEEWEEEWEPDPEDDDENVDTEAEEEERRGNNGGRNRMAEFGGVGFGSGGGTGGVGESGSGNGDGGRERNLCVESSDPLADDELLIKEASLVDGDGDTEMIDAF